MQKQECGGRCCRKTSAAGLIEAIRRQCFRRAAMQRRQRRARTIDDGDRHEPRDVAPALPAIEAAKIIRPHEPNEMDAGTALLQINDRLEAVSGADRGLNRRDNDTRMPG